MTAARYSLQSITQEQSIVQLVLKFGSTQEVKSDTAFEFEDDHMVLTHASKGKTVIMYDSILFINTVPKGSEPRGWHRDG